MDFTDYKSNQFFDELFSENERPHPHAEILVNYIKSLSPQEIKKCQKASESLLLKGGLTFNVYGDSDGVEKIFPFDIVPRLIRKQEWEHIEKGIAQRVQAINCFLNDIYSNQQILKDKIIPKSVVLGSAGYRHCCIGLTPQKGIWNHISGTDIIRDANGTFYVLEDNIRCPSGVSYMLKNREILKQTFSHAFSELNVASISNYPTVLLDALHYLAPESNTTPTVVVLTPGMYNAAYFEHAFLAQQMGVPLVEGCDLVVDEDFVYMRTTKGLERVDVIYRRVDDDYLDPTFFKADSLVGVRGLMESYLKGNVVLANAPGTGVGDDKAIYSFVEKIIRYYLNEEAILPNVSTYICCYKSDLDYVLDHIEELVVKPVNQSGGYGMLIGPTASKKEIELFKAKLKDTPEMYIAQPTISLSTAPTVIGNQIKSRHVDLRPFTIHGKSIKTTPGGLTRVALKANSLVVNSSQGGGSKDSWVVDCSSANHTDPVTLDTTIKELRDA